MSLADARDISMDAAVATKNGVEGYSWWKGDLSLISTDRTFILRNKHLAASHNDGDMQRMFAPTGSLEI